MNDVTKKKKTENNSKPALVNIIASLKFDEIVSICFKDIERKRILPWIKGNKCAQNDA